MGLCHALIIENYPPTYSIWTAHTKYQLSDDP